MKASELFPSRFLKAANLPHPRMFVMNAVTHEKMPDGQEKPVLWFQNEARGLVLNPTNRNSIQELFGDIDVKDWAGKSIELYSTTTEYAGKIVPCIRVRAPSPPVVPQTPQLAPAQPVVQPAATVPQQQVIPTTPRPPVQAPPTDVPFDA